MADEPQESKSPGAPAGHAVAESVGEQLLKELTSALLESTKATRALNVAILGRVNDEGQEEEGLLDALSDMQESMDGLAESVDAMDERITALNLKYSSIEYVLDQMAAISEGDLDASPVRMPRVPTWEDAVKAKREFDRITDEEAAKAEDAEKKALEEAASEAQGPLPGEAPAKPSMLSNRPPLRKLPSLPVVTE